MKTFNIKNTLVAATLLASSSAMAGYVQFDSDGTGSTYSPLDLNQFNLQSTLIADTIIQDLGTNNVLSSGDTFTESLSYVIPFGFLNNTFTSLNDKGGSNGFFSMTMDLVGHIDNFSQFNPFASDITTASSTWDSLFTSTFDVVFDFASAGVKLFWNNTDNTTTTTVGVWDVLNGGASTVVPNAGQNTQPFAINLAFNAATSNDHFMTPWGSPISDLIVINQAFGVGTGSANPTGIVGTSGSNAIKISAVQNGTTMRFAVPEPTSVAILGLGLLGFAGAARRRQAK